jgi:hypothetical protein
VTGGFRNTASGNCSILAGEDNLVAWTRPTIPSGNPRRIARRARNIAVRTIAAKLGLFRALFGGRR